MITIKKYANRRLYNINSSSYITLAELAEIIKQEHSVHIIDAKTGQNLTRQTLIQVILEIEQIGHNMLPIEALRQIIMAYDSPIEPILSRYLERTMSAFARHHNLVNDAFELSLDAISTEHNMNPQSLEIDASTASASADSDASDDPLDAIRKEMNTLKARLKSLET